MLEMVRMIPGSLRPGAPWGGRHCPGHLGPLGAEGRRLESDGKTRDLLSSPFSGKLR